MEEIRNKIEIVINALNNVETKGVQNMSNMVGCINILQQIHEALNESQEEK